MSTPVPAALLTDFGGVLTTNVFDTFATFCTGVGLPADAVAQAFRGDEEAARLLVAVETGELSEDDFGRAFAPILTAGTDVELEPVGLIDRISASLEPDDALMDVVARIQATGVTTAIVSNSFGYAAYDGYGLADRFDHVILSGRVGLRKPSRSIYRLAAELCRIEPEEALFVDDLAQNVTGAERTGMRGLHHRDATTTVAELERIFELEPVAR